MKKSMSLLAALMMMTGLQAQASVVTAEQLNASATQALIAGFHGLDVINWKVGDTAELSLKVGTFGKIGTMVKSVTKDEGTAIWMRQEMKMMGQSQTADALINKADGKVLKMVVNGKEQPPSADDEIEVISQEYTEVKVPAGTFKVIYIVAKTKTVSKIEVWANPKDIVIDGTAKQSIPMQFGQLTMELLSQKRGQ